MTNLKEKPIFFNTVSVQGILKGIKTQTRRAFRPPWGGAGHHKYQPGDILWVRETWVVGAQAADSVIYRADYAGKRTPLAEGYKWKPSMIMPRDAARIFLRVTDVRLQRLQDISERDAIEEGLTDAARYTPRENIQRFADFWDSFNSKRGYGWDTNPWVWAYTFELVKPYCGDRKPDI
jgi:hypothetical protein